MAYERGKFEGRYLSFSKPQDTKRATRSGSIKRYLRSILNEQKRAGLSYVLGGLLCNEAKFNSIPLLVAKQ